MANLVEKQKLVGTLAQQVNIVSNLTTDSGLVRVGAYRKTLYFNTYTSQIVSSANRSKTYIDYYLENLSYDNYISIPNFFTLNKVHWFYTVNNYPELLAVDIAELAQAINEKEGTSYVGEGYAIALYEYTTNTITAIYNQSIGENNQDIWEYFGVKNVDVGWQVNNVVVNNNLNSDTITAYTIQAVALDTNNPNAGNFDFICTLSPTTWTKSNKGA